MYWAPPLQKMVNVYLFNRVFFFAIQAPEKVPERAKSVASKERRAAIGGSHGWSTAMTAQPIMANSREMLVRAIAGLGKLLHLSRRP